MRKEESTRTVPGDFDQTDDNDEQRIDESLYSAIGG